jgi:hypothetical protein
MTAKTIRRRKIKAHNYRLRACAVKMRHRQLVRSG